MFYPILTTAKMFREMLHIMIYVLYFVHFPFSILLHNDMLCKMYSDVEYINTIHHTIPINYH